MIYKTLSNGIKMPMLGYGVYQVNNDECERCVSDAISVGYRLIDTAQAYGNEEGVGNAIKKSGIPRNEFFIITKVWITNAGEERAYKSILESLERLKTDYIDLLLIHQPFGDYYGTYRAMERAYKEGKIKALGISNFSSDRMIDLYHFSEIKPVVNQVETHVFNQQKDAKVYMDKNNIACESWGPFAEGRNNFFQNEVLISIGKKYNKSVAQVALRYLLENDVIVIPKSVKKERMEQNFDVFDFTLSKEDKEEIAKLDTKKSLFFSHQDPQTVEWFMSIL